MKQFICTISMVVGTMGAGHAQSISFDPNTPCRSAFQNTGMITQSYMGAWTLGFLAGSGEQPLAINEDVIAKGLKVLQGRCSDNIDATLVEAMAKTSGKPAPTEIAGSEQDARRMLSEFLKPNADTAKLIYALKPSEDDVRAVYREPLATTMIEAYAGLFRPGIKIGPKAGQTELLTYYSTTGALRAQDQMLQYFPGGYGKVLEYMIPDFPIVRLKFVKPGETSGLGLDGLIFVNNHWVLMPKPWRALK